MEPLPIPSYLKRRPRCNSYPSPPDIKIIARIKRPPPPPPPRPPSNKKSERSNSCPVPQKNPERSQRKSF